MCDSHGSFYSRIIQLILKGAKRETHVSWELVLLHVLARVDDVASDCQWSQQPERDATYCGIYLDTVRQLIEVGYAQSSSENFNAFIVRSLIEVWYLSLQDADEKAHKIYYRLILELKPCAKFRAAYSPNGLKIVYARAFQLLSAKSNVDTDSDFKFLDALLEQLFLRHQKADTISCMSDYFDIFSPMFIGCLDSDEESSRDEKLLSGILIRSFWIAEGHGHLESFVASLARWLEKPKLSENHPRYYVLTLVCGCLHLSLGDWSQAHGHLVSAQERWPAAVDAMVNIEDLLDDVEAHQALCYRRLQKILVSLPYVRLRRFLIAIANSRPTV